MDYDAEGEVMEDTEGEIFDNVAEGGLADEFFQPVCLSFHVLPLVITIFHSIAWLTAGM